MRKTRTIKKANLSHNEEPSSSLSAVGEASTYMGSLFGDDSEVDSHAGSLFSECDDDPELQLEAGSLTRCEEKLQHTRVDENRGVSHNCFTYEDQDE